MQRFLDKVSRHLLDNYGDDIANVCIVLPNRRAGLFIKKNLPQIAGRTIWSPEIFSIEDFCHHISGLTPADPIGLLFDFYQIHRQIEGDQAQPFDEFIQWAQVLIADFDEVDKNLVDAAALFNYLSEAKAIEKWRPDKQQLSETAKSYIRFYRSLIKYYDELKSLSEKTGIATEGRIYRVVAENIETIATKLRWRKIIFAGFNALTASEERITKTLADIGLAEMLWDADNYYLNNTYHEAGLFLRKELQASGRSGFRWISNGFAEIPKKITICGAPKNLGQARYAAEIAAQWRHDQTAAKADAATEAEMVNTALVLTDESQLFPVLSSLHDSISHFNVTMGYPVNLTIANQFFNLLFRVYENVERFVNVANGKAKGFYYADLIHLFSHPYFGKLCDSAEITALMRQSNRVFYTYEHLAGLIENRSGKEKEVFNLMFSELQPKHLKVLEIFSILISMFGGSFDQEKNSENTRIMAEMELEYLNHIRKIIIRLEGLLPKYSWPLTIKTLRKVYGMLARTTRIPFEGEPLQGMQVMGLLETRALDFDKVVIISANEGNLPSVSFNNSFIPPDIRREFALPLIQEKNAVFAYHFYRLLQRAKEVHLVYNTEADDLGGGEPSRFIYQLMHELEKYQPEHQIKKVVLSLPAPTGKQEKAITIEKDEQVFKRLLDKARSGLSPTSINRYKSCPLQFYFSEIAQISEPDEVEETLEARSIGTIVHKALELLYSPFTGKTVTSADINIMKSQADEKIAKAFADHYTLGEITFGRNRLISEVIKNFVFQFLEKEKTFAEQVEATGKRLEIIALEKVFKTSLTLPDKESTVVNLKGFIDRVDRVDDLIRIIDYKTGRVELKEYQFNSFTEFTESDNNAKSFQVLMYAWLYNKEYPDTHPNYESGVISMRTLSSGLLSFGIKPGRFAPADNAINSEKLELFEGMMQDILVEIFDKEHPFHQTDDQQVCMRCDFKDICMR